MLSMDGWVSITGVTGSSPPERSVPEHDNFPCRCRVFRSVYNLDTLKSEGP